MKSTLVVLLLASLVGTSGAFAGDSAAVTKARDLRQKIEAEQAFLGTLENQFRDHANFDGSVAVRLTGHAWEALWRGAVAGYLLSTSGYDTTSVLGFQFPQVDLPNPFVASANGIRTWGAKGGAIVGWLPKQMVKEVGYYGMHGLNMSIIGYQAVASAVKTLYATGDGGVLVFDGSQALWLKAHIFYIQQKLTSYVADLQAIEATK